MIRDLKTGKFIRPMVSPSPLKDGTKKTAWVFSGAGSKILFECGAAKALQDLVVSGKIEPPSCLIGTSSGGLTSAYIAAGQLDVLYDLCLTVKNKDIYTFNPFTVLFSFMSKKACVLNNDPLRKTITKTLNCDAVRKYPAPVLVNVTNVSKWIDDEIDLRTLNDHDMVEALMTTTSVPLAFPVNNGCVDGGIVDNYPIFDAVAQQVDRIIVVITSTLDPKPINTGKDMASELVSIMLFNQLIAAMRMLELVHLRNPNIQLSELITIEPAGPLGIGLLDADHLGTKEQRAGIIQKGYDQAMKVLKNA